MESLGLCGNMEFECLRRSNVYVLIMRNVYDLKIFRENVSDAYGFREGLWKELFVLNIEISD